MIDISKKAITYLERKQKKFQFQNCRIFLVAQHCHGSQFAYRFDKLKENDTKIVVGNLTFAIEKRLLDLFKGFKIELRSTFLMDRLLIIPIKEQHVCSCQKAN